jgi:hypothetical protein
LGAGPALEGDGGPPPPPPPPLPGSAALRGVGEVDRDVAPFVDAVEDAIESDGEGERDPPRNAEEEPP